MPHPTALQRATSRDMLRPPMRQLPRSASQQAVEPRLRREHGDLDTAPPDVNLAVAGTTDRVEPDERGTDQVLARVRRVVDFPGRPAAAAALPLGLSKDTLADLVPELRPEIRGIARESKIGEDRCAGVGHFQALRPIAASAWTKTPTLLSRRTTASPASVNS